MTKKDIFLNMAIALAVVGILSLALYALILCEKLMWTFDGACAILCVLGMIIILSFGFAYLRDAL